MSVCQAMRHNGLHCKAQAISGATVCRVHGGSAPQVRRKAAERLAALVDPAIGVLQEAMKRKDGKGKDRLPDSLAIAAARDVLDRCGHKSADKMEISGDLSIAEVLRQRRTERLAAEGSQPQIEAAPVIETTSEVVSEPES